jgi:iron complex outermembrane receptor protein
VSVKQTEIIPQEPDPDNTGGGKPDCLSRIRLPPPLINNHKWRNMLTNMLSRLTLVVLFSFLFILSADAQTIRGVVLDAETNEPLAGANVVLVDTQSGTATGFDGSFELRANAGDKLQISFVGYEVQTIIAEQNQRILLTPTISLEQLIIEAVRAESIDPVTQSTISRRDIQKEYKGEQPIFYLERLTPSITSFSESGTRLFNGGQMRLRGIGQERINITLNGVPLNDMIDHGVFFSNFTDISGSFESVQVQRGVGTSSNGVASYAGSVNFESVNLETQKQGGSIQTGIGSFATSRLNGTVSSGLVDDKWALFSNFSKIQSDGYRDNTFTDSYSFFISAGYFGEKDLIKINAFDARSKNGLGYLAEAESVLETDQTINSLNENDQDDFGQRFVQFQHTRLFSEDFSTTSSLYYGGASGDYFFTFMGAGPGLDQINYPLRNDHYGLMINANYAVNDGLNLTSGIHVYQFDRTNEESNAPDFENPYYRETSSKNEISWFGRADWTAEKLLVTADIQFRTMELNIQPDYDFIGIAPAGDIVKDWTFINPRIGLTYRLSEATSMYASVGRTGREPTKIDIFGGFNLSAANYDEARSDGFDPEYVTDIEAGIKANYQKLAIAANFFYMDFKDEIAPIGEVLAFGVQRRENIENSYRAGIELEWAYLPMGELTLTGNATFMQSEIESFTDGTNTTFENVQPVLTPEFIFNQSADYIIGNGLSIGVSAQYVGESYLALDNQPEDILPSAFVMDSYLAFAFKNAELKLQINNVLDETYYSSGVPVDVDFDGTNDDQGYFVNAGRNFFLNLTLNF